MKDSPEISIDQDTAVPRKTFSGRLLRDDLCESSLKLNVRFGQSKLVSLVPILCIASLLANVYFASTHRVDLAERTLHYLKPVHDSILVAEMNATSEIHVEVVTPIIFSTFMHALTTKPDGEDSKPRLAVNSSLVKSTGQIFEYERNLQRRKRKGFGIIAPQPKSLSRNATFAACLLIKDDNEILNEWIAYHYHSLNMRFLIVAVDPHSSQSPSPILDKWKLLTDLNIIEWSDDKYMPKYFLTKGHAPLKYVEKSKTLNNVDNDG